MPGHPAVNLRDAESLDARVDALVARQSEFFASGATLAHEFRHGQLTALSHAVRKYEPKIHEALHEDLRKSKVEAYGTEIGFVLAELRHTRKHLAKWMRGSSCTCTQTGRPRSTRSRKNRSSSSPTFTPSI